MIDKVSYSDGLFLKALSEQLEINGLDEKAKERLAVWIVSKSERVREKANGYWQLPAGKKIFLQFLDIILGMLRTGTSNILLNKTIKDYTQRLDVVAPKCKAVFLAQEKSTWPSMESVYQAMEQDERFEAQIVYIPFAHVNKTKSDEITRYKQAGFSVLNHTEYDLTKENPDVVFFAKPYGGVPPQFYIREVEKVVDRTVYIPYGMEINFDLIFYGFQNYLHYRAWKHIGYGPLVKEVGARFGFRNGENIAVWGHPKADQYLPEKTHAVPNEWKEKIGGRRVLLWCPHHTIVPGPECVSTWMDFSETVFTEVAKHRNIVLLWRPHPMLLGALVNNHHMTQEEMETFIEEKTAQDNIILDCSEDYQAAFSISNGIISDGTTFSIEYLYTGKPLLLTTKKLESFYNGDMLEKGLYIGKTKEDIITFIDDFSKGKDPKRAAREELKNKMFFHPEGKTVGENIADNIILEIQREEAATVGELMGYGRN